MILYHTHLLTLSNSFQPSLSQSPLHRLPNSKVRCLYYLLRCGGSSSRTGGQRRTAASAVFPRFGTLHRLLRLLSSSVIISIPGQSSQFFSWKAPSCSPSSGRQISGIQPHITRLPRPLHEEAIAKFTIIGLPDTWPDLVPIDQDLLTAARSSDAAYGSTFPHQVWRALFQIARIPPQKLFNEDPSTQKTFPLPQPLIVLHLQLISTKSKSRTTIQKAPSSRRRTTLGEKSALGPLFDSLVSDRSLHRNSANLSSPSRTEKTIVGTTGQLVNHSTRERPH